jgi:hypothetical protein
MRSARSGLARSDKQRSWKDGVVSRRTDGPAGLAKHRKVTTIRGYGRFTSPHRLQVELAEGRPRQSTAKTEMGECNAGASARVRLDARGHGGAGAPAGRFGAVVTDAESGHRVHSRRPRAAGVDRSFAHWHVDDEWAADPCSWSAGLLPSAGARQLPQFCASGGPIHASGSRPIRTRSARSAASRWSSLTRR